MKFKLVVIVLIAGLLVPVAAVAGDDPFLWLEEVEGEIQVAKDQQKDVTAAEAKINEARKLFEIDGKYAAARLAASKARALLVAP